MTVAWMATIQIQGEIFNHLLHISAVLLQIWSVKDLEGRKKTVKRKIHLARRQKFVSTWKKKRKKKHKWNFSSFSLLISFLRPKVRRRKKNNKIKKFLVTIFYFGQLEQPSTYCFEKQKSRKSFARNKLIKLRLRRCFMVDLILEITIVFEVEFFFGFGDRFFFACL